MKVSALSSMIACIMDDGVEKTDSNHAGGIMIMIMTTTMILTLIVAPPRDLRLARQSAQGLFFVGMVQLQGLAGR